MAAASPKPGASRGSYPGAVGIVASAGGIPALIQLLGALSASFPLPIFVAQHLPRAYSNLDLILSRRCSLRVRWAEDGPCDDMKGVTLAVPGTGIRVTVSGTEIDRLSPLSASWLPSGDRMIQSLVPIFGVRTIAIVLSGMLPAGVEGIRAVRACGGITMAQNRASASDFEMPSAAIDFGRAEIVAPPWRMAEMLTLLAEEWSVPLVSAKSFVTATPKGVRGASRA